MDSHRKEYTRGTLDRGDLDSDPIRQFEKWLAAAFDAGKIEPNAMTLATADSGAVPDARMVLLKSANERGFTFATNYRSCKGEQLSANPRAALVFYWPELERQVRVRGEVEKISEHESDVIFEARPIDSRRASVISEQSAPVPDRSHLDAAFRASPTQPSRPDHWGGYLLIPVEIEFWQGGRNRLHDRFLYRREGGVWTIERLWP